MGEVFFDAFLDTLKLLPVLLAVHLLIELAEQKASARQGLQRLLNGNFSPLVATAAGVIPQCGFGVVSADMYTKKAIPLSALIAVILATSDEALPIMLSSVEGLKKLWPLLLIKTAFALAVGYVVFIAERIIQKHKRKAKPQESAAADTDEHCSHICCGNNCRHIRKDNESGKDKEQNIYFKYFHHPLIHTLKTAAYILAVNIILGLIIYFVGADKIASFMDKNGAVQPFISALVGIIPNCAASVLITQMYVAGSLNLGAAVAGLSMSAGLCYAVLLKDRKNIARSVLIIISLYSVCSTLGFLLSFV